MTYRRLAAGTLILALACAALASGGFSAMELDRNVAVEVVDDEHAIVGVEACYVPNERAQDATDGNENSATPVRIELTNRLAGGVRIEEVDGDTDPLGAHYHPRADSLNNDVRGTNVLVHEAFILPFSPRPSEVTVVVSMNNITAQITADIEGSCQRPVGIGN